ncbi:IclR family transcriptional regulator [Planomonospora alba]
METTASAAPASMIDRVVQILETFDAPVGLTLAQVVSRTGLPRSSTHRILEHLVKIRWLRREGNTYQLGLGVLELGTLAVHQHHLRKTALPYLHELQSLTGMVVHLAVLDGPEIVYLDKIGGRFGMSLPSRIGGRQPAHFTAVGKALLADSRDEAVRATLAAAPDARTARSITTEQALKRELGRISERGVAFDREESAQGIGCVAAPIGPPGGPGQAAVSVCGPIGRIHFDQLVGPVRAAASQIWNTVAREQMRRPGRLSYAS